MFRGLMTIATAVAVLWHTVAGCCAHHSHGGHSCDVSSHAVSQAHYSESGVSGGCCKHALSNSRQLCASEASGRQFGNDFPSIPCPGHKPKGCSEGTCVFAAPVSSGSSTLGQFERDGSFVSYAVDDQAVLLCASSENELHESFVSPTLGGLRLHLAHCVLTL